ncbi:uncharacterized protein LOC142568489 [Dermacentor variabilis]|uniref:uncharacterized protein LOC142568489 n=1 Tax=Dermacentor variabilis TaxID=34621 RepID=UPI003F5B3003
MRIEKARIEAELDILQHEKEAAAANAQANALEAAVEQDGGERMRTLPPVDRTLQTRSYIDEQQALRNSALVLTEVAVTNSSGDVNNAHTAPGAHTAAYNSMCLQADERPPDCHAAPNNSSYEHAGATSRPMNLRVDPHPLVHAPAHNSSSSELAGVLKFLCRKDLVSSGLIKFDDRPENFRAWKSSFKGVVRDLGLSAQEELDLLIKWLGPESSRQARRLKSVHVDDFSTGLNVVWKRLDDVFGRPEAIEDALLKRLEDFPKISHRENTRLQELGDLLLELEAAKTDPYLAGLGYLDTARGVNKIVSKLPSGLQENWMSAGSKYKKDHDTAFPPFSFFSKFVRDQASMRNDPSFILNPQNASSEFNQRKEDNATKTTRQRSSVSARKTEVDPASAKINQGATANEQQPESRDLKRWCPYHKKPHPLERCRAFREKTLEERQSFIKKQGICLRCCSSKNHMQWQCQAVVICLICDSADHATALHPAPPTSEPSRASGSDDSTTDDSERRVTSRRTEVANAGNSTKSCAKICLVEVTHETQPEKTVRAYAILDDQSNRSLVRPELLNDFGVKGTSTQYTLRTCSGSTEVIGRVAHGFFVQSMSGEVKFPLPPLLECKAIPENRDEIPTPDAARHYPHLKSVANHIPPLEEAGILLLLGRDILRAHKVRQTINGPHDAPYAQKLDLGWVIVGDVCVGRTRETGSVNVFKTHVLYSGRPSLFEPCQRHFFVREAPILYSADKVSKDLRLAATLDDTLAPNLFETTELDKQRALSMEDKTFLKIMNSEFTQDKLNNWVAPLPFRTPRSRLPNNREQALSRLLSLRRSLRKNPETRERFVNFMNELFIKGHAEEAPPLHVDEECWYLPIFGVHHPQKPDQIRVVFDSSAQYEGVSLNNVLLTGPDLTNNLVGILIRFRQEPVAVTADVQQMFYSFMVREDHQNYLRFLWFKDNDISREIIECRMKVHVFGNSPSPAVSTYGLRRTAQQAAPRFGEDARKFIERDFYVDDALKSLPSEEDAISLLQRTQKMLATANIRLHKIASNRQNVLNAFPREDHAQGLKNLDFGTDASLTQRSLGLLWDIGDDSFVFRAPRQDRPYTRRGVLSTVNSLYDPLGFVAPITVQGKYLLHDLVTKGYDWDTPLSDEKKQRWDEWKNSLQTLQHLHVRRTYTPVSTLEAGSRDIHVFSDASTRAVAAVAYLRVTDKQGNRHVGFVMGKAKLAPQPEHTIPRLELCAAVLAVEMTDSILRELDFQPNSVTFYTNSKVVLGYIYNETRRFYVYVANRVQRIRSSTQPEQWKYVHTDENPADHATRAIPAAQLKSTNWLSGPDFLSRREEEARSSSFILLNPDEDKEIRPEVCTLATEVNKRQRLGAERFHRFSNWKSLTRAVASLIQVAHRAKNASQGEVAPVEALSKARLVIIRAVQQDAFYEEICCIQRGEQVHKTSSLRRLDPFLDANGLIRVGGRLNRSDLPDDEKHPLLMPGRHHVATLLVRHHHECVQHQGRHFTEGAVRAAGYWIVGGKRCISSVLQACISCKKLRGRFHDQKMADLPADRISTDPPFTNVGIDVFGPWMIASRRTRGGVANSKGWAVMFTCLSIRAVHIELIESMDTSSFINAFRRFLAVRGPIKLIRSDCGTNFIGACRELGISAEGIHRSQIGKFLSGNGCKWIFNPPHASHMGGAWERMIGIARRILDSMLMQSRHQRLTHDILATFLAEVAAIINARPITPTSSDPEDPTILTPATLLTQKHGSASVTTGQLDTSNLYKRHWRLVQNLADEFWKRWRTTYVTTLQQRRKWQAAKPDLKEGDVVLLRDKEATRNDWPVGVITRSLLSADGRVRKVELKTAKDGVVKTFFRPTTEVVRLL